MKTIQSLTALKGYLRSHGDPENQIHESNRFPAITITRQCGSRAQPIVDKLIDSLQETHAPESPPWILFENELILRVLREANLPETLAKHFPEDPQHAFTDTVEEMVGLHPSTYMIHQKCNTLIRTLCRIGHCIIIGRAANFATRGMPHVFNVRLVGSIPNRLMHLQDRLHLSEKDAQTYMAKKDKLCQGYAKDTFNISDINDPSYYDMVLNTDYVDDDAAVRAIKTLMVSKSKQPTFEFA